MTHAKRLCALVVGLSTLLIGTPVFADRPPAWMVGTFRGYNRKHRVEVELRVTERGDVTARGQEEGGERTRETGYYREGRLYIGSVSYFVDRTNNGIRLTQANDRDNRTDYRRSGGSWHPGTDDRDVPTWLIGSFNGYNRKYRVDVDLTITSGGSVVARGRQEDGKRTTETGSYRDDRLIIGDTTYNVDRTSDGIRLTQTDDRNNRTEYRRDSSWSGEEDRAEPPPSWMVGVFRGYNRKYAVDVEMDINAHGFITARGREDDGSRTRETGYYRDGRLTIGKTQYYADRRGRGFRLTQEDDRDNWTDYRR